MKIINKNTPILVTGHHRSGTTWVGKVLSKAPRTGYIHEPFNISNNWYYYTNKIKTWFFHIDESNQEIFHPLLKKTFSFNLSIKDQKKLSSEKYLHYLYFFTIFKYYQILQFKPLIKDPIAFFSAGWIADEFNCKVIVTIRHPASFVASLKVKKWKFNFNNFYRQKHLMEKLEPFAAEIEKMSLNQEKYSIIDQGILLWRIFAHQTNEYKKKYPNWFIIRHMDLINNPKDSFKKIFEYCDLRFTDKTGKFLERTMSSNNPKEVKNTNDVFRDTHSLLMLWKKRLSSSEVEKLREGVEDYYYYFYNDGNWL